MKTTPSSIICFKNGYSFFSVPVALQPNEEKSGEDAIVMETIVGPLPQFVVHGTIGLKPDDPQVMKIFSLSKAPIENMKKKSALLLNSTGDSTMSAILHANVGRRVLLTVTGQDIGFRGNQTEGNIKKVFGEYLILEKNPDNEICEELLSIDSIKSIVSCNNEEDGDSVTSGSNILVRHHIKDDQTATANLSYLTRGFTWAPSYSLVLDTINKTVSMEGKACLLCDISFLDGDIIPEVSLVAGHPNIQNQNVNDPLISGDLSPVDHSYHNGPPGAPAFRSQMRSHTSFAFGSAHVQDAEGIAGGEAVEDFFHYVLKNVPVKNGHPISLDFIKPVIDIKYEDVYYINLDRADLGNKGNVDVKHAIGFKNISGQPLTTGPVTVLCKSKEEKNDKFLVQGLMKFTGKNQDANVEITTSMDVLSKFTIKTEDTKVDEKRENEKYVLSTTYQTGEVEIINMKDEDIKCKVEYTLCGTMIKSEPEFKDKTENSKRHLSDLNLVTKYVWEVNVGRKQKGNIKFNFCWKEMKSIDQVKSIFGRP